VSDARTHSFKRSETDRNRNYEAWRRSVFIDTFPCESFNGQFRKIGKAETQIAR